MNYSGMLLSVEGLDGSGKDTIVQHMEGYLVEQGYQVEVLHPLKDSYIGDYWYTHILSEQKSINPYSETLLVLSAMADLMAKRIMPALGAGKIVLLNRWLDSTAVYQGEAKHVGMDLIDAIATMTIGNIKPDYTLFLDVDPAVAKARMKESGRELDLHEKQSEEFHVTLRKAFHMRIFENRTRFLMVDANRPLEEVKSVVSKNMDDLLRILGSGCSNNKRTDME